MFDAPALYGAEQELLNNDLKRESLEEHCSAVIRLYKYEPDAPDSRWRFTGVWGILTIAYDERRRCFYFRVLHIQTGKLCFEHEIYEGLRYVRCGESFHCFEGEGCLWGFSFAEQCSSRRFLEGVKEVLEYPDGIPSFLEKAKSFFSSLFGPPPAAGPSSPSSKPGSSRGGGGHMARQVNVSEPEGFRRVAHVGISADGSLDVHGQIPPEWRRSMGSS
eukprot:tig00021623_g23011.t1